MSWLCKCGILNSGLNSHCAARLSWRHLAHYQVSDNTPDFTTAVVAAREVGLKGSMTDNEKLYAEFYAKQKLFIKDMDMTQLREHREKLAEIAFQAKASLAAADDDLRERRAKEGKKDWLVTPVQPNQHTDAINAVKLRKERMSKLDKQRADLLKLGMDEEIVNEIIRGMEKKATEKVLNTIVQETSKAAKEAEKKTVTFTRKVDEIAAIQVQPAEPQQSKPFDWGTIIKKTGE